MEKEKYYRNLYLIGAWWNWILGISFIFATFFMKFAFGWFGIALPKTFVWMHLFFILFFLMGFVSYQVYKDPVRNYFFGKLCVYGRLIVIITLTIYYFLHAYNALIFLIVVPGTILMLLSWGFIGYFKDKAYSGG